MAATNEYVEFQTGAMKGHATGADYSSDSGLLMLHSAVSMSGMAGKRALTVTAATADFDNPNQEIFLTQAKCVTQGQTVEAQRATLHTTARWNAGAGGGRGRCDDGGEWRDGGVAAGRCGLNCEEPAAVGAADGWGEVLRRPAAAPAAGRGGGGDDRLRCAGEAAAGRRGVRRRGPYDRADKSCGGGERAVEHARSDRREGGGQAGAGRARAKPQLRDVEATGSARLVVVGNGSTASTRGVGRTELSADDLKAHLTAAKDGGSRRGWIRLRGGAIRCCIR